MIADRYDAFLFDLDGVLYRGAEPVDGAAETLATLRSLGKGLAFMTNNSSRTPEAIAAHLTGMGIRAAPEEVETSALATATLLRGRAVASAYVLGEEGLRTALAAAGLTVVDGSTTDADTVVVGWDRGFDYAELAAASVLIQRGASLVASNADASYPVEDGLVLPGAGAILAAIQTATGVSAEVVGKPNAPIFWAALDRAGGGRPLVIGDRLDTDIEGARRLGWDSLLVLTGITGRADIGATTVTPTYIAERLGELVEHG
jgi:HAD superfamily hydrolase (TIGR01457 family)